MRNLSRKADAAGCLSAPGDRYGPPARYANELSPIVQRLIDKLGAMNANVSDRPALARRYVGGLRSGDLGVALAASAPAAARVVQASSLLSSRSILVDANAPGAPACGASLSLF
jgi:hypothetical protein